MKDQIPETVEEFRDHYFHAGEIGIPPVGARNVVRKMRTTAANTASRILDKTVAEGRSMLASEKREYEKASEEVRAIDELADEVEASIAKLEERRASSDRLRDKFGAFLPGGEDRGNGTKPILPTFKEYRALSEGTAAAGGYLVPPDHSRTWFDVLRAESVVMGSGVRVIETNRDEVHVPKVTESTSSAMVAEGAAITEDDPTFGELVLTPRKAAAFTLVSNEALEDSEPAIREVLAYDHLKSVASLLDAEFLAGSGSAPNLRGIRNMSGVTTTSLGANGAAPTLDNIADAIERLNADNAEGLAIYMATRTWTTLRKLKDGQNRYQLQPDPTADSRKQLFGVPVYTSTQISTAETQGTATNASWIAVVDTSQLAIARRRDIKVEYSTDFKFQNDQTAVRTTARFDIGLVNDKGVELITGVTP